MYLKLYRPHEAKMKQGFLHLLVVSHPVLKYQLVREANSEIASQVLIILRRAYLTRYLEGNPEDVKKQPKARLSAHIPILHRSTTDADLPFSPPFVLSPSHTIQSRGAGSETHRQNPCSYPPTMVTQAVPTNSIDR